jgi:hypothetical protein
VKRWLIACLTLGVFCAGALSQQTATTTHQHPQPEMIDGKVHPELIPDLTAYRLYFLVVSRSSTAAEQKSQAAHVSQIRLSDRDTQTVYPVLSNFRQRYAQFIEDFNKQAEAKGQAFDPTPFLKQRDALVQSTHDTLQSVLTPDGYSRRS